MTWPLSIFAEKLGSHSGINELMRDLAAGMSAGNDLLMLGGGNPAHIPAVEQIWRARWQEISSNPGVLERILGDYDGPLGNEHFLDVLTKSLHNQYGWEITAKNVAIVNGSQNAFFYLFNMLGGKHANSTTKKILFPLSPEYIGYADQAMDGDMFRACPPKVDLIGDHQFKYCIDFDQLEIADDVAAMCVSRPTNPTGNVLTDSEIRQLDALAAEHNIPLIIDNAYGAPFPDIIFNDVEPTWSDNTILAMSLSKLGLPGTRTGIILAREAIIETISAMHAVVGLANGNIGQAITAPLLEDKSLYSISREIIRPFYQEKSRKVVQRMMDTFDPNIPYRIHVSEGALFIWLWFDELPITDEELYQRLKKNNLLVVPGHYFFYGLEKTHPHQNQCIRLSYSQDDDVVFRGIDILAEEIKKAYEQGGA